MNPPFNDDITDDKKRVTRGWVSWFQFQTGGGKVTQPAVGGSPFTYRNTTQIRQEALVTGGTVSSVQFSRDNINFYTCPGNQTVMLPGDYLKITWSGLPTLTIIPI